MIIVCLGDSLTEGDYGIKGKRGIANVHSENYPYFLSRMLNCEVRNFGKCGYRSSDYLRFYRDGNVNLAGADYAFLMLGSNGGQKPTGDTPDNLAYVELIKLIQRDAPGCELVLMTPPHATENPEYSNCGYMPQVADAQGFVRNTAAALGLPLIDLGAQGIFSAPFEYVWQPNDGLHFGFMGYSELAQVVYSYIVSKRPLPLDTIRLNRTAKLVAHRGLSGIECENTCASFIAAGNRSYYGEETDVWLTKDGKPVCCHDSNIKRVSGIDFNIPDHTFAELQALCLNDFDRKTPMQHLKVPTLEEYVRVCKKYNKHSVCELKADFTADELKQLISVFEAAGQLEDTTFIAFNLQNLILMRSILPAQPCQYLMSIGGNEPNWADRIIPEMQKYNLGVDLYWGMITKESVDKLHAAGIEVNVWTVDNPALAEYLLDCGVDYITTNILEMK